MIMNDYQEYAVDRFFTSENRNSKKMFKEKNDLMDYSIILNKSFPMNKVKNTETWNTVYRIIS